MFVFLRAASGDKWTFVARATDDVARVTHGHGTCRVGGSQTRSEMATRVRFALAAAASVNESNIRYSIVRQRQVSSACA
jgi:hypothetical protein